MRSIVEKYVQGEGEYSFSEALDMLKRGKLVARKGWNGKRMFLYYVQGSQFRVNRPSLLGIFPEGTEIRYHAHIDMFTADGYAVSWVASQTDMLADDWCEVHLNGPSHGILRDKGGPG